MLVNKMTVLFTHTVKKKVHFKTIKCWILLEPSVNFIAFWHNILVPSTKIAMVMFNFKSYLDMDIKNTRGFSL